jgi:O-antigen ligase
MKYVATHDDPAKASTVETRRLIFDYQKFVNGAVAPFVASGALVFIEPSPYDLLFFIAMPLWFLGGFTAHRAIVVFVALLFAFIGTGFLALVPHWEQTDFTIFQYLSAYLALTAVFFALFSGNRTKERVEIIFKAYAVGAVFASICGILGYFNIAGLSEAFTRYGRAMGTFKDPNVFGSFVAPAIVYLAQCLILRTTRKVLLTAAGLLILLAGVLLSFSRGSWGAAVVSTTLMTASTYFTTQDQKMKSQIAMGAAIAVAFVVLTLIVFFSMEETRALLLQRASVTQDYDEGPTGRFGNQARSIPMLLDRFWGFGPLGFRLIFGIEPHNSYLGAFANTGWIGGLIFILLVATTTYVGFRLISRPSPFRQEAQVAFPSLFVFFLQAFQIDIDHWRHFYLLLGLVWGLEAARQKWEMARQFQKPDSR